MKRLLLSVHDVSPGHFERLIRIDRFLNEAGIGSRYAMLVVPDFWHQWPLENYPEFVSWLKSRADDGVEMILHGFYHRDETTHSTAAARWKATVLTAREGEFLGLSEEAASVRLSRGRQLLESLLGRPVRGFVAPAWLYGDGAKAALKKLDIDFAEDHWSVWSPNRGLTLSRSPVISYASRSRARILSSLAWSRIATGLLRPLGTVRLAIHPHDFDVESLIHEIGRAVESFLSYREPVRYHDLIDPIPARR